MEIRVELKAKRPAAHTAVEGSSAPVPVSPLVPASASMLVLACTVAWSILTKVCAQWRSASGNMTGEAPRKFMSKTMKKCRVPTECVSLLLARARRSYEVQKRARSRLQKAKKGAVQGEGFARLWGVGVPEERV